MASAPDQLAERRLTLAAGGRVLVVGGGGGRDIYDALSSGARRVDVIELNRTIVDVVDKDLAYFSGAPYSLPAVHTTAGDGRAILAARQTKRSLPAGRSLGVGDQRFRLVLAAAVATFTAIN